MISKFRETRNAVIDSVFLGFDDHGIFTMYITVSYGDLGKQSFGGYGLDRYNSVKEFRVGTEYGTNFIMSVLKLFEVNSIDKLKGLPCVVDTSIERIYGIGTFLNNKWFYPETHLAEYQQIDLSV